MAGMPTSGWDDHCYGDTRPACRRGEATACRGGRVPLLRRALAGARYLVPLTRRTVWENAQQRFRSADLDQASTSASTGRASDMARAFYTACYRAHGTALRRIIAGV